MPVRESDRATCSSPLSLADRGSLPLLGPHVGCSGRCGADVSLACVATAYFLQYVGARWVFHVRCTVHDVRENSGPISPSEVASLHSSARTLHCAGSQNKFGPDFACRWQLAIGSFRRNRPNGVAVHTVLGDGVYRLRSGSDGYCSSHFPLFFFLAVLAPPCFS